MAKTNTPPVDGWQNRIVGEGVVPAVDLVPHPQNWRKHPKEQGGVLAKTLGGVGWVQRVIVNKRTGRMLDGHLRAELARKQGEQTLVPVVYVDLSEDEERTVLATLDPIAGMAVADEATLAGLVRSIEDADLRSVADSMAQTLGVTVDGKSDAVQDAEPQIDRAEELRQKWGVEPGQMWQLGEHRLICGDCTDAAVVARVMGGERAALVHADPPYGMGKENDGIANDNLYREKLDAFHMAWWKACRSQVEDNGSVYIWGNAEDLWRLWYCGGLKDSERLTLRNEVVWTKVSSQGMGADAGRSYPVATERALFFMLGEQGFNNNADNYWDGWEGIRSALAADCEKMGWTADDIKRITGVGMFGHWFTKSQWTFIPKEHYEKLQAAAREHDAFKREHDDLKREHDDLKREFYATRAFFDNTHDNMTDVWEFPRVQGEDRHGHATPKPVAMMERAIKSSAPSGTIVLVPFNGTGPELIACERLGRRCRAVEIAPGYVAVALERWATHTGKTPVLLDE